ncbi:hypothetical protein D1781_15535 [Amnibacterium setariae]|uniref:Polysaccharide biosynthesis protein n=2 Tax=Amnibacterium setariae TaxID=2306585 RepID=A0A3A1TYX3_9MICO|nr:hypothetical protein D1781_15535 [Amnibacterium setariae]
MTVESTSAERALGVRVTRLVALLAVQVFPLVALALVYPLVAVQLHEMRIGGQSVASVMVTAATLAPLLAQTVSAPVYRLIDGIERADRWRVGAQSLRAIPRALVIGAPIALLTSLLIAYGLAWSPEATAALVGVVELHLLLSALLVASYATGGKASLLVTWSSYAAALLIMPTLVWAPATAAIVAQATILVVAAVQVRPQRIGRVPAGVLSAAVTRGVADVLPLWCIPLAVLAADPARFLAGPVFAGMLPAIVSYHVFFETSAEPMWRRIDRLRRSMGVMPYEALERDLREMREHAGRGLLRVTIVEALLAGVTVLIVGAAKWDGVPLFLGVLAVSGIGVVMLAQVYTYGMLRPGVPVAVSGLVLLPMIVITEVVHVTPAEMLLTIGATYAVVAVATGFLNRQAWRLPEYSLFWRSALSA